jgi:hypothetical protein
MKITIEIVENAKGVEMHVSANGIASPGEKQMAMELMVKIREMGAGKGNEVTRDTMRAVPLGRG